MADDLISRERARHEFANFFQDSKRLVDDCDFLLCTLPSVEAAPVRRGKWEKYHHSYFGTHQCVCSECADSDYWKKYFCYGNENYCSNCGKKMDLGQEER